MAPNAQAASALVSQLHKRHFRELVAPTIRLLGGFEAAEDVVQDAFILALDRWNKDGIPAVPIAWLKRVVKQRAIDRLRRNATWKRKEEALSRDVEQYYEAAFDPPVIRDDALRLIFTCCHPSLSSEAQIALTLKVVCGLETPALARALLVNPTTLQQRIVRAKRKIDRAKIPYTLPGEDDLQARLHIVLSIIYLVFNEGYTATDSEELMRTELSEEALRLCRLVFEALPKRMECKALLALILLHHSRRLARVDSQGELVVLSEQDRSLWDQAHIEEALPLVELCLKTRPVPRYAIEAAISALHAQAQDPSETDWAQIAALYQALERKEGQNPVVALNAAVALAMSGKLGPGLQRIEALKGDPRMANYHLLYAAEGDLLSQNGQTEEASIAYQKALALVHNQSERRHLERKLQAIVQN